MSTLNIVLVSIAAGIFIGWLINEWAKDMINEALRTKLNDKDDELVLAQELIDELQADNNALCRSMSKTDGQLLIEWH